MAREHRRLSDRVGSVRVRTTGAAVGVVGVALVVGAVVLVTMLRSQLTGQVRSSAQLRADDVASALASGTSPTDLAVSDDEDLFIQVIAPDGTVVASSRNVAGEPALAILEPGRSETIGNVPIGDENHDFLVVSVAAKVAKERDTVLVARSTELIVRPTELLVALLSGGIPLLLMILGFTVWKLTGRALSPVEAMRAEVDEISGSELHRRVPDPPGSDEISRLASTMNRMLERLDRSAETQRRFVADASHELRSPVATIRQYAEVAIAHPERISAHELAETILAENLRVQRLVEDLLILARTEQRNPHLRRRAVDIDDALLEEGRRVRSTSALRVDTSAVSAGRVDGDEAQLQRLVRNLVDNAVHHASMVIRLSLSTEAGSVRLVVEDDGPGIPESQRERVFERFVRLDEARARDDGGSGLGLAIVAEITTGHAGSVSISGSDLGGARFEVLLPASEDD